MLSRIGVIFDKPAPSPCGPRPSPVHSAAPGAWHPFLPLWSALPNSAPHVMSLMDSWTVSCPVCLLQTSVPRPLSDTLPPYGQTNHDTYQHIIRVSLVPTE